MIEPQSIITGWKFQALADATLLLSDNCNVKYFNENKIKAISGDNIEEIKKLKNIFVYTHDLDIFFEKIFPKIDNFTLISHNSDHGITEKYLKFLDSKKINAWYSQNCYISHEKLFAIPIGIANGRWEHGNLNLLHEVQSKNNNKEYLVYSNFNESTNITERSKVKKILYSNKISTDTNRSFEDYLSIVSRSKFIVAPPGNGIDCHRIWECLLLKTIPIVKKHPCFNQFSHLPIMYINRWEDVTIDLLRSDKSFFEKIPEELSIEYWIKKIL